MRKLKCCLLVIVLSLIAESSLHSAETSIWGEPITGGSFFVTDDESDVIVSYLGKEARYTHHLYLDLNMEADDEDIFLFNTSETEKGTEINLGKFPMNTELIFRLDVTNTGKSFYSGPGERNPDGNPYAQITPLDRSMWKFGFEDRDAHGDYDDCEFQLVGNVTQTIVPMTPGETYQGSVFPWQYATNYSLRGDAEKSVVIDLEPVQEISSLALDGKIGALPSATEGEHSTQGKAGMGRYQLLISPAESAVYYFSIYGLDVGSSGGQYAITAHVVDHYLSDVSPKSAGNAGKATITFKGLGFSEGMQVQMIREGFPTISPEAQLVTSPTEFTARFDLSGVSVGDYEASISWPDGESHSLPFEITKGLGAKLEARIEPPGSVRPSRKYTAWLEYSNAGDADLPAPLFIVISNCSVSMNQENISGEQVQILGLGSSGMPDVLGVGESGRIPFYFVPNATDSKVRFNLLSARDNSESINWDEQKNGVKPSDLSDEEWNMVWPDLTQKLGNTWSEYLGILRDDAVQLERQGSEEAFNVHELIRLEIMQIENRPTASLGGVLRDEESRKLLGGVPLRLRNEDGTFLRQTSTQNAPNEGHFIIGDLPDGTYELLPEGYYFESPTIITISGGKSISNQAFYARKIPADQGEAEPPEIPDRDPALVSDEAGNLFMVWEHGTQIWWAMNTGEGWNDYGKIPDATGSNPALVYDEQLLEAGTPGFFCAWESGISSKVIMWSVGKISEQGMTWSEMQSLTSDNHADFGIVLTSDANHQPLVLWLQKDTSVEDDTDLYYQSADLEGLFFHPPESDQSMRFAKTQRSAETCVTIKWPPAVKGITLPEWIPVIGGKHGVYIFGQICGETDCSKVRSGEVGAEITVGPFGASGTAKTEAVWETDAKNCVYVFDNAELTLGIKDDVEVLTPPIPILISGIPIGTAKVGGDLFISSSGALTWKSNFPSWPDTGMISGVIGGAPKGKLELLGGGLGGSVRMEISGTWEMKTPPFSAYFKEYCVKLGGTLDAGWGLVSRSWTKKIGGSCAEESGTRYYNVSENRLVRKSYRKTKDEVPIFEKTDFVKKPMIGTGEIYEGNPLLGDISTDVYDDGIAAMTRTSSGEIVAVWTKNLPASDLGSKVCASTYQDSLWTAPVEITPDTGFNKDTAVASDSDGRLIAAWSGASNEGLDYEQSSVEEILDAQEYADIFYAVRTDGTWTQPRKLADLPGRDEMVSVISGTDGEVMALWLNTSEDGVRLYSAAWNGADWSAPSEISNAVLMDKPVIAYLSDIPVAVWAQDTDGDADTFNDWKLHFSSWNGSEWSSPEVLKFSASENTDADDQQRHARNASARSASDRPPEECCCKEGDSSEECKEDVPSPPNPPADPVSDSSSEVVVSVDPNEKVAPPGTGEKHYVNPGDRLRYIVYFENKSDAKAPAQEVFINDTLEESTLDWATLRVEEFSFSDVIVSNPKESFAFSTKVSTSDYRTEENKQWWVEMSSEFDGLSGELDFTFRSLDPETGELPEDVFAGFLPPEDGTGRGQGYVIFSVCTKPELSPGTPVRNHASIVFDTNEPIVTNEAFNTIFEPDGPDINPPEVLSATPSAGANGVGVGSVITVTFSEAMNASSIKGETFRLAGRSGSVSYDSETLTATLTPSDELSHDTAYTVTVTTGVSDISGNSLPGNYVWNFTTEAEPDADECPDDPHKTEPGICGCGVADTDRDGDGMADCSDKCPDDPDKTEPGTAGCGMSELGDDNCFIQTISSSDSIFFSIR